MPLDPGPPPWDHAQIVDLRDPHEGQILQVKVPKGTQVEIAGSTLTLSEDTLMEGPADWFEKVTKQ